MISLWGRPSPPPESRPHTPTSPLRVTPRVMAAVLRHARRADPDEVMGLLASRRGERSGAVTHAVLLDAVASPGSAVADPMGVAGAAARLGRRGLIPRGFWHSHVHSSAYHSSVDGATMLRLLPGMAGHNFDRPAPAHPAPAVTAPDEAWLPLHDGTALVFTLVGPPIPGLDAREAARWESATIRYRGRAFSPRAVQDGGRLVLHGGPVVLTLGLPAGPTLRSRVAEASPVRVATMYSLVINVRGETHAEALTVYDVLGRSFTEIGPCPVEVVGVPDAGGRRLADGGVESVGLVTGD